MYRTLIILIALGLFLSPPAAHGWKTKRAKENKKNRTSPNVKVLPDESATAKKETPFKDTMADMLKDLSGSGKNTDWSNIFAKMDETLAKVPQDPQQPAPDADSIKAKASEMAELIKKWSAEIKANGAQKTSPDGKAQPDKKIDWDNIWNRKKDSFSDFSFDDDSSDFDL